MGVEAAMPWEVVGDGDGGGSASTHPGLGCMEGPFTRNEWPCAAIRYVCGG